MSLKDTIKHLKTLLTEVTADLDKSEGGNKAASQRVRTGTIKLEKIAKLYRKESVKSEKSGSPKKGKSKVSKQIKPQASKPAKTVAKAKTKSGSKEKLQSAKKPTAKIIKKKK